MDQLQSMAQDFRQWRDDFSQQMSTQRNEMSTIRQQLYDDSVQQRNDFQRMQVELQRQLEDLLSSNLVAFPALSASSQHPQQQQQQQQLLLPPDRDDETKLSGDSTQPPALVPAGGSAVWESPRPPLPALGSTVTALPGAPPLPREPPPPSSSMQQPVPVREVGRGTWASRGGYDESRHMLNRGSSSTSSSSDGGGGSDVTNSDSRSLRARHGQEHPTAGASTLTATTLSTSSFSSRSGNVVDDGSDDQSISSSRSGSTSSGDSKDEYPGMVMSAASSQSLHNYARSSDSSYMD